MAKKKFQAFPFQVGQRIDLPIHALGEGGVGIGRFEGAAVFVPGALPGETVRVRIRYLASRYAQAELEKILQPSHQRIEPPCPYDARCGGCQLQHLSYEGQLEVKRRQVADCLERIGGFESIAVPPVMGMEEPWQYRNKAAFPVATQGGEAALGFYATGSHDLVPVDACMIQQPPCNAVLSAVKAWMRERAITPYDEKTRQGRLRHVLIRTNRRGEFMVTLVINCQRLPEAAALGEQLCGLEGFVGLALNVNREATNAILGREIISVCGAPALAEQLDELTFSLSPTSFFQVNPLQTERLYQTALSFAGLKGDELVFDAYCGIGSISLFLARGAREVIGVEIVRAAVEDARENARSNGIRNASFICAKAEEEIPRLLQDNRKPDVVVVDPPRKGCDAALLQAISQARIPRLIYVSCNPSTLARDLKLLCGQGYTLQKVQPVDLFPQTMHVETVVLMSRVRD
ncbi:23S rRNA (uracil(1939)-C(5))-methyltransferase RlmD [Luoshenia tenuis]|jgi:23S rRNA (uracil1939-C5)-methyltransferase|uniref:23S rRNA (uracil(1939)-C(5))-methyltransferase RlmD n=1 Tax=Luoshenia tenuis TaxID=2763654 RepID=UPI003D8E7C27